MIDPGAAAPASQTSGWRQQRRPKRGIAAGTPAYMSPGSSPETEPPRAVTSTRALGSCYSRCSWACRRARSRTCSRSTASQSALPLATRCRARGGRALVQRTWRRTRSRGVGAGRRQRCCRAAATRSTRWSRPVDALSRHRRGGWPRPGAEVPAAWAELLATVAALVLSAHFAPIAALLGLARRRRSRPCADRALLRARSWPASATQAAPHYLTASDWGSGLRVYRSHQRGPRATAGRGLQQARPHNSSSIA